MSEISQDSIKAAVIEALRQGECLLEALSDETYNRSVPDAFDATIGGHYRHCLEHFEALLPTGPGRTTEVDYDARKRDRRVETDRGHALERTRVLAREIESRLDAEVLSDFVRVRCKASYVRADSPPVISSLGREVMYTIVHAIHHYALISIMCRLMRVRLPEGFGVAPSTVQHRAEQAKLLRTGRAGSGPALT